MTKNTKIEWAHHTFNPWIGCTKVSPACDHCYAENMMDTRLKVVKWGAGKERKRTSESNWQQPLKWDAEAKKLGVRHRVFCASLADVFDNEVPTQWRKDLFNLILSTPHLDWLLLTKRIGNVAKMINETLPENIKSMPPEHPLAWPWPHVWIGATICNQEEADRDIPKLLRIPAAKRFLSIEPLLGAIEMSNWLATNDLYEIIGGPRLDWVIVGGESGNQARPMHPQWVCELRDQCVAAKASFFFKQWGEWTPGENVAANKGTVETAHWFNEEWQFGRENLASFGGHIDDEPDLYRVGKKASGRLLDGRVWDEVPS